MEHYGQPKCFNILELGPGRGTIWRIWRSTNLSKISKSVSYCTIVQVLIEDQEVNRGVSVKWLKSLKSIPKKPPDFYRKWFFWLRFDKSFLFKNNTWFEKKVALNKNGGIRFDFLKRSIESSRSISGKKRRVFEKKWTANWDIKYLSEF